jgi:hypothetical protein
LTENGALALTAQGFNVLGDFNGFDAIWVIRVLDAEGANLSAFAQHGVASHHDVFVDKGFSSPLLHTGVNLKGFAISGGATKLGVDF